MLNYLLYTVFFLVTATAIFLLYGVMLDSSLGMWAPSTLFVGGYFMYPLSNHVRKRLDIGSS